MAASTAVACELRGALTLPSLQVDFASTFCGTPYYYSPEMLKGEPYAQPSDCWALGIVLFELLTLERPFKARAPRIVDPAATTAQAAHDSTRSP